MFAYCLVIAACLLAMAEAGSWTKTDYKASIMLGLGFNNETNGMIAAGTYVAVTNDGGNTWTQEPVPNSDLITISVAANGESSGALSGLGLLQFPNAYTTDAGYTWTQTTGYKPKTLNACTSITPFGNNGFIWTGDWGTHSGIITSTDGGATADAEIDWGGPAGQSATQTAYLSEDTWMIAGGVFPAPPSSALNLRPGVQAVHKSPYLTILNNNEENRDAGFMWHTHEEVRSWRAKYGNDTGYGGAVQLTTDGGKTFTTVLQTDDSDPTMSGFYFLGIACASETACTAVAEGEDVGSSLFTTQDGGKTWANVWSQGVGTALASVVFQDSQNGWACGLDGNTGGSLFLVTSDGGQTWNNSPDKSLKGIFPQQIAFNSDSTAFATAITQAQISVLLQYA